MFWSSEAPVYTLFSTAGFCKEHFSRLHLTWKLVDHNEYDDFSYKNIQNLQFNRAWLEFMTMGIQFLGNFYFLLNSEQTVLIEFHVFVMPQSSALHTTRINVQSSYPKPTNSR